MDDLFELLRKQVEAHVGDVYRDCCPACGRRLVVVEAELSDNSTVVRYKRQTSCIETLRSW